MQPSNTEMYLVRNQIQTVPSLMNVELQRLTPPDEASAGETLGDLVMTLWKRKFVLLTQVLLVLVAAAMIVNLVTPLYDATTIVLIDDKQADLPDWQNVFPQLTPTNDTIDTEIQIVQSRNVLETVVRELELTKDPEFNPRLKKPKQSPILDWIQSKTPLMARNDSDELLPEPGTETTVAINSLIKRIQITPVGKSNVLSITAESEDSDKAALISNTIAEMYLNDQINAKFEITNRLSTWMKRRAQELREQVTKAENAVEIFRDEHELIEVAGAQLLDSQMSSLSTTIAQARTVKIDAEARLQQVERLLASGSSAETSQEVLSSSLIQTLRTQQAVLEREIAELTAEYGALHPKMQQLKSEHDDMNRKIREEVQKVVQELQNNVRVARSNEYALKSDMKNLRGDLSNANKHSVTLRSLERDAETVRNTLQEFLPKIEELNSIDLMQQPDSRIITRAASSLKPSFPNKPTLLIIAAIAGLFLAFLLIFLLEQLASGFRSTVDFEKAMGVAALGNIPNTRLAKKPVKAVKKAPDSKYAKALRSIYLGLSPNYLTNSGRVILVTSSIEKEGKTTTAIGLCATHLSLADSSVAIVDLNFENSTLHRYFNIPSNAPGVQNFLLGECEVEDLSCMHKKTGINVIPAGKLKRHQRALPKYNERYEELVDYLRTQFQLTFIDGSQIIDGLETRFVAPLVDDTVFVVRANSSEKTTVNTGIRQLLHASFGDPHLVLSNTK